MVFDESKLRSKEKEFFDKLESERLEELVQDILKKVEAIRQDPQKREREDEDDKNEVRFYHDRFFKWDPHINVDVDYLQYLKNRLEDRLAKHFADQVKIDTLTLNMNLYPQVNGKMCFWFL